MKRCLIVVDYQNDFVTGSLGFPEAAALQPRIAQKIQRYRADGDAVLFTFDTHEKDYLDTQEGRYLPVKHCIRSTDGHRLYGQVADLKREDDLCFYKDVFGSGALYEHLKTVPYESIELVGVVSNICVISNAVLAKTAQPQTPVLVDASCTASNDSRLHQAALDVMAGMQIQVTGRKPHGITG